MNRKIIKMMEQGHCEESIIDLSNSKTLQSLSEVYFYYMKECIKKEFPPLDFMRKYFRKKGEKYGVLIDSVGQFCYGKDVAVLGNSDVVLNFNSDFNGRIYLRHDSKTIINTKKDSFFIIKCYENTQVRINGEARGVVHLFDNGKIIGETTLKVKCHDNIQIRQ